MEIYIVEDDMSVISVLQDIIEDNDLGIVCGTSEGRPADVDDILAKNPDMVLIDFLMPEKDGVQVMRELRGKRLQGKMHHDFPGGGKRIDRKGIRCGH